MKTDDLIHMLAQDAAQTAQPRRKWLNAADLSLKP
jgi:hypothetical protein